MDPLVASNESHTEPKSNSLEVKKASVSKANVTALKGVSKSDEVSKKLKLDIIENVAMIKNMYQVSVW